MDTLVNGRIRGHSQLQGKHKAFEEVFGQLWDLLGEDLADEGDELVILVAQRGELGGGAPESSVLAHRRRTRRETERTQAHVKTGFTLSRS